MGVGAAARSFQARICSSATKDNPFIHVSTKCVTALTLVLVILSGKGGSWISFYKRPFRPRPFHSKPNGCFLTYDKCFVRHSIFVNFTCIDSHRFLLWFTISIIVCLCMYVLVIFFYFILNSRLAIFGKKLSFWFSACSGLIVLPLL